MGRAGKDNGNARCAAETGWLETEAMITEKLRQQYEGYSDEELLDFLGQGVPLWQEELFQQILQLRQQAPAAPSPSNKESPKEHIECSIFDAVLPVGLLLAGGLLLVLSFTFLPFIFCFGALGLVSAAFCFKWHYRKNKASGRIVECSRSVFLYGAFALVPVLVLGSILLLSGVLQNHLFPPTIESIRYGSLGSGLNIWTSIKRQWPVLGKLSVIPGVPSGLNASEQALYRQFREARDTEMASSAWRRENLAEVRSPGAFVWALQEALENQQVVDQRFIAFYSNLKSYTDAGGKSVVAHVIEAFASPQEEERNSVAAEQARMETLIRQYGDRPEVAQMLGEYRSFLTAHLPKAREEIASSNKQFDLEQFVKKNGDHFASALNQLPPEAFSSFPKDDIGKASTPEMDAAIRRMFPIEPDYSLFGHEPPPR